VLLIERRFSYKLDVKARKRAPYGRGKRLELEEGPCGLTELIRPCVYAVVYGEKDVDREKHLQLTNG